MGSLPYPVEMKLKQHVYRSDGLYDITNDHVTIYDMAFVGNADGIDQNPKPLFVKLFRA